MDMSTCEASRLFATLRTADAHNDLPYEILYRRKMKEKDILRTRFLPDMRAGGVDTVIAAVYLEDLLVPELATRMALEQIGCLAEEIDRSGGEAVLCSSAAEMDAAHARGAVAFWISLEGVEPVHDSLALMEVFRRLGVRLMGLTWARPNTAAYPASMKPGNFHLQGLTDFGRELVGFARDRGMAIDLSHLGEGCVQELLASDMPRLYASHANARTPVGDLERNLSDETIRALADRGGVIGINAIRSQLSAGKDLDPVHMAEHMEYIRQLTGHTRCIGLGLDFCDKLPSYVGGTFGGTGDVLSGYAALDTLVDILLRRGWQDGDIRGIMGDNWRDLLRRWFA